MQRELARVEVDAGDRGAARCGSPTSARCSATTSRVGPRAPTSAPAASRSARWCRCGRSRTGWSACSASTTACSRAQRIVDGDDVLARDPVTGERDIRSEDRQLLLDAIGAATETLVVTYTGADPHTGQDRPPAVPLGELLDGLDRTTEAPVRDRVVCHHPLQPYDVRNVEPGRLGGPTPFSFDPRMLAAARRDRAPAARRRSSRRRCHAGRRTATTSRWTDLVEFFKDPVKGFFRAPGPHAAVGRRRGQRRDAGRDRPARAWGVGDRMLDDMLRGIHPDTAREIEWRRGALPPGQLGWRKATEVRETAMNLAVAAMTHRQVAPQALDVDVDAARRPPAHRHRHAVYGDRLVAVGYSKLDGKHLLESWVRLLALAAGHPDAQLDALTIGRAPRGTRPPSGCSARRARSRWACSTRPGRGSTTRAVAAPLQLPLKTSSPGPRRCATGRTPRSRRPRSGVRPLPRRGRRRRAHVRVWGEHADLDAPHRPAGTGRRLWFPLLDSERGADVSHAEQRPTPFDLLADCPPDRPRPSSRPAPAPARPTRSPPWSPATSPRAGRCSTTCCSSPSAGRRARSCASGSATSSSGRPRRSTTRAARTTHCSPTCRGGRTS